MMQQKIDNLSALSKYRSELMGIAIIWIVLFHSNISAPDNFFGDYIQLYTTTKK